MSDASEWHGLTEMLREFFSFTEITHHTAIPANDVIRFTLHVLSQERAKRPIVGTTADGVEVREGDKVFLGSKSLLVCNDGVAMYVEQVAFLRTTQSSPVSDCYSTPEAARAARKEQP